MSSLKEFQLYLNELTELFILYKSGICTAPEHFEDMYYFLTQLEDAVEKFKKHESARKNLAEKYKL